MSVASPLEASQHGLAQSAYVSALGRAQLGPWRVAAATDVGEVTLDLRGFDPRDNRDETGGARARAEIRAGRDIHSMGLPLSFDLGARDTELDMEPFRRGDGLWTMGPQSTAQ